MKYLFHILLTLSIIGCVQTPQDAPIDLAQAKADRVLIREYIALQEDMVFDSTDSGIFYALENKGYGDPPSETSTVKTHYDLYLVDGTLVDSSHKKEKGFEFRLKEVIRGWQEAIQLMGVGGKGTFVIPSGLAYGKRGMSGYIPPNAVLVFDIELLEAHDN